MPLPPTVKRWAQAPERDELALPGLRSGLRSAEATAGHGWGVSAWSGPGAHCARGGAGLVASAADAAAFVPL